MAPLGDVKLKFIQFLDNHRDMITYSKKGYIKATLDEFMKEFPGEQLTQGQVSRLIGWYRMKYHVPLQYVKSKYYTPVRDRLCISNFSRCDDVELPLSQGDVDDLQK